MTRPAIEKTVRDFPFLDYGIGVVDPSADLPAEWVSELAKAIGDALTAEQLQGVPTAASTLFALVRDVDVSGVSGTGVVADGVIWPDGSVSVRWRGEHPSIVFWRSVESVKVIHGHNGATRIVLTSSARERLGRIAEAHSKDTGPHGTTSGQCSECGWAHPCPTFVWATTERDGSATWDPRDDEPEGESR
ncbi:hypothetical protein ACIBQ1_09665 [Nonomuraea sp. NPDC050153]|uniref:hypothetical protein n=1 Tax=Nonomuraea sp. NPDC050153 TaxID=3364359 RepID=UPI003789B3B3